MSALEQLRGIIGNEPAFRGLAESILSKHAHELAEKIRDANRYAPEICLTPSEAADLIDPEVE